MRGTDARHDLARALVANHCEFFARFGRPPLGDRETHDGVTTYRSGVDHLLFNGAFSATGPARFRRGVVEDVVARFRRAGLPFVWWSLPTRDSEDLGRGLTAMGFVHEGDVPGMAIELSPPGRPPPTPSDLRISLVQGPEELDVYCRTLNAGDMQAPEPVAREMFRAILPEPGDRRFRFFLGYLDGRPVATSMQFVESGVVGIYGVATIPEMRRRGLGAALTYAAVDDGRRTGLSHAVLGATEMGEPVYRRLGFEECCRIGSYLHPVEPVR